MRLIRSVTIFILLSFLFTGCATVSTAIDPKLQQSKIYIGMTKDEAVQLLGRPIYDETSEQSEVLTFAGSWCTGEPRLMFKDGKLISYNVERNSAPGCS